MPSIATAMKGQFGKANRMMQDARLEQQNDETGWVALVPAGADFDDSCVPISRWAPALQSLKSVTFVDRPELQSGTGAMDPGGEPTSFPLYKVVDGWTERMQLVGEGGMIELWVPSKLGYGELGSPGSIPPHSNLQLVIERLSVD